MRVLAIDTSADDTCSAVVEGRRVISHVEYSQISLHEQWGGIYPSVARRAHEERIEWVVKKALTKAKLQDFSDIDAVAVTTGPGLAIALEVGINFAKQICHGYKKPFISVNHMEGHLYSSYVQNQKGQPNREPKFPTLGLLISGGHSEIVLWKGPLEYQILGETVDDAAGEAFDKASRMLGFSYPGGPIIERLAENVKNIDKYNFPRPMAKSKTLDLSFSGLKTALLYKIKSMTPTELNSERPYLASSFQEALIKSVVKKLALAIDQTNIRDITVGGGVSVNSRLRLLLRKLCREKGCNIFFPSLKYLNFDNAAMIGVVGAIRAKNDIFVEDFSTVERRPRMTLAESSLKNMLL